jgi:ribonuclease HI
LIPEELLERRSDETTTLLKNRKSLKDKVFILEEEEAKREARKERDGLDVWTDGSRKEDEWVGCAVVWKKDGRWEKRRVHLGRQKEAFDAELYAVSQAKKIGEEISEKEEVRRVMVFTDTQVTLQRIQLDKPGPGQVLAFRTMRWESELLKDNIHVQYQWVPAHNGIEGNEQADQQGTKVAYMHRGQYTKTQILLPY